MSKYLVMLIEDDSTLISKLVADLKKNHYSCIVSHSVRDGLCQSLSHRPEFIIVDLDIPGATEILNINNLSQLAKIPIILISHSNSIKDKIKFMDMGADDYISKPFVIDELIARMRAINRRIVISSNGEGQPVFNNGNLVIDYNDRVVTIDDNELYLTPIEYKLLCLLSYNVGKVVNHSLITKEIWGTNWESDMASLRVYVASLRKKLNIEKCHPGFIETQVGVGYKMIKK